MISMISLQIVKHITQNLTYRNNLIIIEEENYGWKYILDNRIARMKNKNRAPISETD